MIKGVTASGFDFEIDPEVTHDMEWVDIAGDVEDKPQKFGKFIEMTLGKDQKKRLYDHVRQNGRVTVEAVSSEFAEILLSLKEDEDVKNS